MIILCVPFGGIPAFPCEMRGIWVTICEDLSFYSANSVEMHLSPSQVAFLDKFPLCRGHTLVVPKTQVAQLHDLDEETAAHVGRVVSRVAGRVMSATGCTGYNVLQNNGHSAGQEVQHVHFHIIPRWEGDYGRRPGALLEAFERMRSEGNPRPVKLPDAAFTGELAELRDAIRGE